VMRYPLNNILFLDIETVPQYASYEMVPDEWKQLWNIKASYLNRGKEGETESSVYPRAGIYAEFGRIVCISCGVMQGAGGDRKLLLKSFRGHDEKLLLHEFADMLIKWSVPEPKYLCAHNGKEFDFPYLCRRMIIQDVSIPPILDTVGKKPWEINHIDTMELWKFGDFKNFTSLNLLAHALGVPTPKDDIDGSLVWHVYWEEQNLERIAVYCQKDVATVANVILRFKNLPLLNEEQIVFVE